MGYHPEVNHSDSFLFHPSKLTNELISLKYQVTDMRKLVLSLINSI